MSGGIGNDSIDGSGGNDELIGNAGADILTGGGGADVFTYTATTDSPTSTGFDVITDFTTGSDLLDFSGISHTGTFSYRGTSGFTGSGNPEARLEVFGSVAVTHSILHVDVNGDATADMQIELTAVGSNDIAASDLQWDVA